MNMAGIPQGGHAVLSNSGTYLVWVDWNSTPFTLGTMTAPGAFTFYPNLQVDHVVSLFVTDPQLTRSASCTIPLPFHA
jgi:hypothetical protein